MNKYKNEYQKALKIVKRMGEIMIGLTIMTILFISKQRTIIEYIPHGLFILIGIAYYYKANKKLKKSIKEND